MEKPIDQLVHELENGPIHIRLEAVRALVAQGKPCAIRPLIRALERTLLCWEERFLVSPLVHALGQLGAAEAQDTMVQVMEQSISSVKAEIVETLGRLGPSENTLMRMSDLLYSNESDDVKKSVIRGLGASGNPRVLKHLLSILEGPCSSDLRDETIQALAGTRNPTAVGPLVDHFSSESNDRVRLLIIQALASFPYPRSIDFLTRTLAHHNSSIRRAACETLGQLRAGHATEQLRKMLTDHSREVRESAARALGLIVFLPYDDTDSVIAHQVHNQKLSGGSSQKGHLPTDAHES